MASDLKDSGLKLVGAVSWGFHLCLFYRSQEDLLEILLPYIKAGLKENDQVIWITSEPLPLEKLEKILRKEIPGFDQLRKKGQLELYSTQEWYFPKGIFLVEEVLNRWQEKEKEALKRGFSGLRVTGNVSGISVSTWSEIQDYERRVQDTLQNLRMMAICQYDLNECYKEQVLDIDQHHPLALVKQENKWKKKECLVLPVILRRFKEKAKLYETLVRSSHAGVLIVDDQFRFKYINDEFCELLGYSVDEVIGKDFRQFLDEESRNLVEERYMLRQKGEKVPPRYEFNVVHKSGEKRRVEIISTVVKDNQGRPQTVAQLLDITEKRRIEKAFVESEAYYRRIFENAHDAILVFEPEKEIILDANIQACRLYGLPRGKLIGRSLQEFSKDIQRGRRYIVEVLKKGHLRNLQTTHRRPDGQEMILEVNAALTSYKGQLAIISIHRDITEKVKINQALEQERAYLNKLFEDTPLGIVMADPRAKVLRVNKEFERLFGYQGEEICGRNIDELIIPSGESKKLKKIYDKLTKGQNVVFEAIRRTKKGKRIEVQITVTPIIIKGESKGFYALYQDITRRKRAARRLKESLKEKTVLLQEIHHRVKNNMQLMASLLRLQALKSQNKEFQEMVEVSQNRIRSMALIHESLYQFKNLARIDFTNYVQRLVGHLYSIFMAKEKGKDIKVNIEVHDVFLDINQAIPCGLIINELVSNAFKYAFIDCNRGRIEVKLYPIEKKNYQLIVSDDGVGLPEEVDLGEPQTLGLQIVTDLVGQLGGHLQVERTKGTTFKIIFPQREPA